MSDPTELPEESYEPERIILSDLINRVLDKGVVISSHITISIADVDLIDLDLRLLISAVATLHQRIEQRARNAKLSARPPAEP
ncbi:MAG TPA: gas vesicle protein GvpJ [Gemmatimonadaceae bacterium]|nr:gas vesicle protein GvpJ [Gemmatimonadaceae bacterium]